MQVGRVTDIPGTGSPRRPWRFDVTLPSNPCRRVRIQKPQGYVGESVEVEDKKRRRRNEKGDRMEKDASTRRVLPSKVYARYIR